MWAPLTPDADHRVAIAPEANDSAGSANTAVAPGTPACQAQLSFTTTPQPPSPMNEDCEGPTVFGFPENAGALRNLTRDDLHLRFPSGPLSGSPVALINKIQYLLTMLVPQGQELVCHESLAPEQGHLAAQSDTVLHSEVVPGPEVASLLHSYM